MSGRVTFVCDGEAVEVDTFPGETLLTVLRERLGITTAKDGCAPQGQCGCCTVLVDGDARVACVTPAERIAGRTVTTLDGLPAEERDALSEAFTAAGASQCGFCTPGILVRAAALRAKGRVTPVAVDRALAAHLCRCTGWRTIVDAITAPLPAPATRSLDRAARRAELEGGRPQRVGPDVTQGRAGFADDTAPRDALVAVPLPPGSVAPSVEAAGLQWVVAESLHEARELAGKVQGRRTTLEPVPPLPLPPLPDGGVRLATSWLEPAYLELDASWCVPGGTPADPLANGGAFGAKQHSPVARAARELADRNGRAVRTLFSREDAVRHGDKPPPFAASAVLRDGRVLVEGVAAVTEVGGITPPSYRSVGSRGHFERIDLPGPPTTAGARLALDTGLRVLMEGALDAADFDRGAHLRDERSSAVFLDNVVSLERAGAIAGARVQLDGGRGTIDRIDVRVAAGDPLDEVVLRSYAIAAAHMALGWVFAEGLAVDADTGEVHDLTIRSFGIIPARNTPPIDVTIVADPGPPLGRASDAVFGAVAASAWNAVTRAEGERPETFPALHTRAARKLRA